MEDFKSFDELLTADERWANFVLHNPTTNTAYPYSIKDRYEAIESITLLNTVPLDVQSQFNVARMICVYAWLYYPLHQIAELKVFSVLEMALKLKFNKKKATLNHLLKYAVDSGLIVDSGFTNIQVSSDGPSSYSKKLPFIISSLRNDLAHGSEMLHPGSIFTLRNCAEIINQLFIDQVP